MIGEQSYSLKRRYSFYWTNDFGGDLVASSNPLGPTFKNQLTIKSYPDSLFLLSKSFHKQMDKLMNSFLFLKRIKSFLPT